MSTEPQIVPKPKVKRTLREQIEHAITEANELEARAAALLDRAAVKRRTAERKRREAEEAAS